MGISWGLVIGLSIVGVGLILVVAALLIPMIMVARGKTLNDATPFVFGLGVGLVMVVLAGIAIVGSEEDGKRAKLRQAGGMPIPAEVSVGQPANAAELATKSGG